MGNNRISSVTTTSKTILLAIAGEDIHECLGDDPQILAELVVRMKGRKVGLDELLKHNESVKIYKEFLEEMHGEENLRFYEAAAKFRMKYEDMTENKIKSKAESIVKQFLLDSAVEAVNAPHNIYKQVEDDLQKWPIPATIFDDAMKEIYNLMDRDLYQRFKKSGYFTILFDRIKVYDDFDMDLLA